MSNPNFYELIPDLKKWGDLNGHPFEPQDWLCGVGTFELAIAFSTVFWPKLVEYDGCVFIDEPPDPSNYRSWLVSTKNQKHKVERVLNHLHLEDIFATVKPTHHQLEYLGPKICEMWKAKAKTEFPQLDIVVEYYPGDEANLSEYQITLYQSPPNE